MTGPSHDQTRKQCSSPDAPTISFQTGTAVMIMPPQRATRGNNPEHTRPGLDDAYTPSIS